MAGDRPSREHVAYSGGSQMGVPFPGDDDERDQRDDQDADDQDADNGDDQGDGDDGDQGDGGGGRRSVSLPSGGLAGAGAGWVLGMLLWGWVVLPFVKSGPTGVKNTLRAKFINQAPDGSPLP